MAWRNFAFMSITINQKNVIHFIELLIINSFVSLLSESTKLNTFFSTQNTYLLRHTLSHYGNNKKRRENAFSLLFIIMYLLVVMSS